MLIKYSLAIAFFMASLAGKCQQEDRIKVSGKLDFAGQGKRILNITYRKMGGGFMFDSAVVSDGDFKFEKQTNEPIVVVLSLKQEHGALPNSAGSLDYRSCFLLPGNVTIHATENIRSAGVKGKGAVADADYQVYLQQLNSYTDTLNRSLTASRSLSMPQAEREKWQTRIADSVNVIRDERVYLNYIMSKPGSPVASLALLSYAGEPVWTPRKKMAPEKIEKLLYQLPKRFLAYPSLKNLKEELLVSKSTGTGRPIIDFELEDTSGKLVKLSDFKGQYVFLDFWASWCVPCRKENPNVKSQFEKYKNKGFTVVSVSLDRPDARKAWMEAIRKDQIGLWTHVSDLKGFDSKVAQNYYVKSIPTNFLIGPDGKFLGRNLYGEALDKALSGIFNSTN